MNGFASGHMASTPKGYMTSRLVPSDTPMALAGAVRDATRDMRALLGSHSINVDYLEIALLGHAESWDGEGRRWVHVCWGF